MPKKNSSIYTIDISTNQLKWKKEISNISPLCKKVCKATLDNEGINEYFREIQLSILLTDDKAIQDLNLKFRGKNKPTNVLSFSGNQTSQGALKMSGRSKIAVSKSLFLGDIVLSYETIKREAKEQNKSLIAHTSHMLIHGTLHLLGYDHEKAKDRKLMEQVEIKLLAKMRITNPYIIEL